MCQKLCKLVGSRQSYSKNKKGARFFETQKLESLAYIFVAACMVYLHSNLSSGLQQTHLFCNRVRFGRLRSFRVIQSRWFWYQWKARMRLPISRSLWLWSYLAPFLRYGDLLAKNCLFFLPLSYSAPSLPMFPLEFFGEVNRQETRIMGLSSSEDRMIVARVVLAWHQRVTDGRTVGRSDGQTDRIYHG